ncbi:IS5 family transposase [Streptomyces longwoodensis]|uniref:IS5 family transposase n=1 Tax=Streptomyces longwoodensis TaxID=68231 RepID=UPI003868B3A5
MRDGEMTDAAWAVIEPLLPPAGRARGRWRDHRQVLEGIVFKFRTGVPWRDLPEWFGPWQTVHGRFARWAADGTFDRLLAAARQRAEVDWLVALDSTIVRAHQHAGGQRGLEERGLGRSRGGLTTKIHLACDGRGRPLAFTVTAGTRNDCTQAETVIDKIRVTRPGPGRPRVRPERVVADKGYSARTFRAYLRRRGIKATIPERVDQLAGRRRRRERPCGFDRAVYRRRNVVERCFHRLKQWRGIATRYEKQPGRYLAAITLASTLIRLQT